MRIRSFRHKGLRLLFADDSVRGLPTDAIDKLRKMLAFLQAVSAVSEVRDVPVWKAHQLTGNRRGTWSLHVTRNWRLTFRIEEDEIVDLDLEDYH